MLVREADATVGGGGVGCGAGAGAGSSSSQAAAGAQPCLTVGGLEPLAEEASEGEGEEDAGGDRAGAAQERVAAAAAGAAAAAAPPLAARATGGAESAAATAAGGAVATAAGGVAAAAVAAGWVWRTPLERSAPHWEGWYTGLSDMFLKLQVPKVRSVVPCALHLVPQRCSCRPVWRARAVASAQPQAAVARSRPAKIARGWVRVRPRSLSLQAGALMRAAQRYKFRPLALGPAHHRCLSTRPQRRPQPPCSTAGAGAGGHRPTGPAPHHRPDAGQVPAGAAAAGEP